MWVEKTVWHDCPVTKMRECWSEASCPLCIELNAEIENLRALLKQFYDNLSHKPSLTATSTSVSSTAEEN